MRRFRLPSLTSAGLSVLLVAGLLASLHVPAAAPAAAGPICHDKRGVAAPPTRCLADDYSTTSSAHDPAPGSQPDLSAGVAWMNVVQDLTAYTVFWLPPGQHYEPNFPDAAHDTAYEQLMQQWIKDVGGTPYYNLLTQYHGQSGPVHNNVIFGGSYVDTTPYPNTGRSGGGEITDDNFLDEVNRVAAATGWPGGYDHMIIIFTGRDIYIKEQQTTNLCGFHDPMIDTQGQQRTYAAIADHSGCEVGGPHTDASDGAVSVMSHEVFENVTDIDPNLTWSTPSMDNQEIGDRCEWQHVTNPFTPTNTAHADVYLHGHPYVVQQEWSNAVHTCAIDYCPDTGVCQPSITQSVTASDPTPVEGHSEDLTVNVSNLSDTAVATNVVISGVVPSGYTVNSVTGYQGTSYTASTFTVTVPALPVHGTESFDVNVTVGAAGFAGTTCSQVSYTDLLGGHQATLGGTQCARTTPTPADAVVTSATGWNKMFADYGDLRRPKPAGAAPDDPVPGQWNGGDGAQSTLLPNGDTAWFFNDSFWGQVATDGTRPLFSQSQPRNMVAIQSGTSIVDSWAGAPPNFLTPKNYPGTLVVGPAPYNDANHYNLTGGDGIMAGDTLYKFYTVMDATGGNSAFPDAPVDTALASYHWNGSTLDHSPPPIQVIQIPITGVSWGIALLNDGGYTYIYGVEDQTSPDRYLHIARVPQGQLTNWSAWEFRTDTGWSNSAFLSSRIMPYVSEGFSVSNVNGTYVLLTTDTQPGGIPWSAVAYYSATPWDFASASKHPIFTPPLASGLIAYEYRIHPQFSSGRNVLIGYSVNTLNIDPSCMPQNYYDATIYRPRFLEVQLPGIGGASGPVHPNITGAISNPEFTDPKPVAPESEVWHSIDPDPNSWSSTVCSYTNPTPSPTPTLTASANSDASISLHWTVNQTAMWVYNLQYHDDTADPNWNQPPASDTNCANAANSGGWCTFPYPMEARNDLTLLYLQPGHTYRYRVQVGKWRATGGTWSAPVTAVAYLAKPTGRPVNVQTTTGNGAVTVTWSDPDPNAWFKILYRDGNGIVHETTYPTPNRSFTWYDLPAGTFNFTVVENNLSGDGPESSPPTPGTSLPCGSLILVPCDHP